jgi:hypothetical protein
MPFEKGCVHAQRRPKSDSQERPISYPSRLERLADVKGMARSV